MITTTHFIFVANTLKILNIEGGMVQDVLAFFQSNTRFGRPLA